MGEHDEVPELFRQGNPRITAWFAILVLLILALAAYVKYSEKHTEKKVSVKKPISEETITR